MRGPPSRGQFSPNGCPACSPATPDGPSAWMSCSPASLIALGGEAGARLLGELGVRVSGGTLLEHIRRTKLGRSQAPRILSVDDFAFAATTKVVGTRERIAETTNKRIDPRRYSSVAGWPRLSVMIVTIIKVSIGHDSAVDRAVPLRAVPLVALSFAVGCEFLLSQGVGS
jgi:hypothetical protein